MLSDAFWIPLRKAGGECRWFNPFQLRRFGFRDHRKLLVCDDRVAFVGGYNIAAEYEGDGVSKGWRDLAMRLEHPVVAELAASFDLLYAHAAFRHRRFARWRRPALAFGTRKRRPAKAQLHAWLTRRKDPPSTSGCTLLLDGPGARINSFKRALRADLSRAGSVRIMTAYFLPTFRIRHGLLRLARKGGRVQLIFAGKSDVRLAQLACQHLYTRLLKTGVEIYEYQPQMLHAKMVLFEDRFYTGSANLDVRSLNINYELMLRIQEPALVREAAEIFEQAKSHSVRITLQAWRQSRSFWTRLQETWAHFILARLDPIFIRWQMRHMR
jgi:cardiolipin synthase